MNHIDTMKQAIEALESCGAGHISDGGNQWHDEKLVDKAITALRKALAEQSAQTDWEAVAADQAMTIALLKAEQPAALKDLGL